MLSSPAALLLSSMVGLALFLAVIWLLSRIEEPTDSKASFWMQQAMEKDLEIWSLRAQLAMQADLTAKAHHALQRFTALCAERHVDRPQP